MAGRKPNNEQQERTERTERQNQLIYIRALPSDKNSNSLWRRAAALLAGAALSSRSLAGCPAAVSRRGVQCRCRRRKTLERTPCQVGGPGGQRRDLSGRIQIGRESRAGQIRSVGRPEQHPLLFCFGR